MSNYPPGPIGNVPGSPYYTSDGDEEPMPDETQKSVDRSDIMLKSIKRFRDRKATHEKLVQVFLRRQLDLVQTIAMVDPSRSHVTEHLQRQTLDRIDDLFELAQKVRESSLTLHKPTSKN